MSKKKSKSEYIASEEAVEELFEKEEPAKAAPAPAPKPKTTPKPEPVMTFSRYFAHTGKPAHHKAGMLAYLNNRAARGKRTVAAWDALFKTY